jgi:anthranilate/para-aminobenzoate synthase component II
VHGKTSPIMHDGRPPFDSVPSPFWACRYHSLVVARTALPSCLEPSAWLAEEPEVLMGLRHRRHPTFGLQFHPESFCTAHGVRLIENFLSLRATVAEPA